MNTYSLERCRLCKIFGGLGCYYSSYDSTNDQSTTNNSDGDLDKYVCPECNEVAVILAGINTPAANINPKSISISVPVVVMKTNDYIQPQRIFQRRQQPNYYQDIHPLLRNGNDRLPRVHIA